MGGDKPPNAWYNPRVLDRVYRTRKDKMPRAPKQPAPKKGNGQGSITALPNGKHLARYTHSVTSDGKQRKQSKTFDTKGEAARWLNQVLSEKSQGTLSEPGKKTLREVAAQWLEVQGVKDTTLAKYRRELALALEHLGHLKVLDLRASHFQAMLKTLSERVGSGGLGRGRVTASSTLAGVRTRLTAVLRFAKADRMITVNPADTVKRVKPLKTEHPGIALDFHEVDRFRELGEALHAAGECRLWVALDLCVSIGLRKGEVMGLRWSDINLETRQLQVAQNLTTLEGKPVHRDSPKTDAGNRSIKLSPRLVEVLKAHRNAQDLERQENPNWNQAGAVFATKEGDFTHPDKLTHALASVLTWSNPGTVSRASWIKPKGATKHARKDRAVTLEQRLIGISLKHRALLEAIVRSGKTLPTISLHDLRHTAATLMLRRKPDGTQGIPVATVANILGHSKISMTHDIYRHVLESEIAEYEPDTHRPIPRRTVPAMVVN
jgi:integrase